MFPPVIEKIPRIIEKIPCTGVPIRAKRLRKSVQALRAVLPVAVQGGADGTFSN
jgi:hypothetical protein